MTIAFELQGQQFVALNGGPGFPFTNAVSLVVNCESQEEIDHYWEKLAAIRIRRAVHASLKLALVGKREQRAGCLG